MARHGKNKRLGFGNLGLLKDESDLLQKLLLKKDISCKQLQRTLTRRWIEENKHLLNEKEAKG